MSQYFKFPMPIIQSIGLVCVSTTESADAGWIERKPVAAAVLTLSQRDDGHIHILHEVVTAIDELQYPLTWLVEHELFVGATTLVGAGDAALLVVDAAQQRFFVEPKLQSIVDADSTINVVGLAGDGIGEAGLCRRLNIPRLELSEREAARIWTWHAPDDRVATLGRHALARAVTRLMLWANLMATRHQEPGWFYETMLGLRCWLDERQADVPELYAWGTSRPIMRAVSFVDEYRRDLGRRLAGQERDWPPFGPGLFHI